MEQELMTRMRLLNVAMVWIGNSLFVILGEDVLPERINNKGTLNVDLLSPEKGSLRKSVAETHEETETTDSDPINATLH